MLLRAEAPGDALLQYLLSPKQPVTATPKQPVTATVAKRANGYVRPLATGLAKFEKRQISPKV